jgi:sugar lactone lactonase YvrE
VSISNGIVWTADKKTMYYIDTPVRSVRVFDYDVAAGSISKGRTAFEVPEAMGFPDGMAVDSEDMLWIAHYGGAAVRRWDPATGSCLETVHLPVTNVTFCAFGGPDLRDLFITTAGLGRAKSDRVKEPHAGGLFCYRSKVQGVLQHTFG